MDKARALASLGRLANVLRDVNEAADLIREFGSIEDHRRELEAQRDKAISALESAREDFEKAKRRYQADLEDLAAQIAEGRAELQRLREQIEAENREAHARATLRAADLVAEAERKAENIVAAAKARVAEQEDARRAMQEQIDALVARRDGLASEVDALTRRVAEVREAAKRILED